MCVHACLLVQVCICMCGGKGGMHTCMCARMRACTTANPVPKKKLPHAASYSCHYQRWNVHFSPEGSAIYRLPAPSQPPYPLTSPYRDQSLSPYRRYWIRTSGRRRSPLTQGHGRREDKVSREGVQVCHLRCTRRHCGVGCDVSHRHCDPVSGCSQ